MNSQSMHDLIIYGRQQTQSAVIQHIAAIPWPDKMISTAWTKQKNVCICVCGENAKKSFDDGHDDEICKKWMNSLNCAANAFTRNQSNSISFRKWTTLFLSCLWSFFFSRCQEQTDERDDLFFAFFVSLFTTEYRLRSLVTILLIL